MRKFMAIAFVVGITPIGCATAQECQVEDWRHYFDRDTGDTWVEGVTTCEDGIIAMKFRGPDGEFVSAMQAAIIGSTFETWTRGRFPDDVQFEYVIEQ